jgi:hypothetical protein
MRSSIVFTLAVDGAWFAMMENAIRSPLAERTIPESAETFAIVPVLALRFPAAAVLDIRRISVGFPASGSVAQKEPQLPWAAMKAMRDTKSAALTRFNLDSPDPS